MPIIWQMDACDIKSCDEPWCNTETNKKKEDMGVAVSNYFYFTLNDVNTVVSKSLITSNHQSSSSEANVLTRRGIVLG